MTTAELFEKLKDMPEAVAKIQAECKTPEEVYNALKELGLTDSFEDFKAKAKDIIITAAEMSFADFDSKGAGMGTTEQVTYGVVNTVVLASGAAAV